MNQEEEFWKTILNIASERFNNRTYISFIVAAQLAKIENQTVTIALQTLLQQDFWEKNCTHFIQETAIKILGTTVTIRYIVEDEGGDYPPNLEESSATYQVSREPSPSATVPILNTGLLSKYSFDNFVQGDGNRWAFSASLAVSDEPGVERYNPLFIYGGPGLGKTHLLHATGNEVLNNLPRARIRYVSAETFLNECIYHIRMDSMEEFRNLYRSLDVLLMDDVQFFTGKENSTLNELFNTFETLYKQQKQIIFTSDRPPSELNNLEERLVSRFAWGMTVDITPPDYETRFAILESKTQGSQYSFPRKTLEYLASQFTSNVRELEGALNNINFLASIKNVDEISIELAAEAIRAKKQESSKRLVIPIEEIQKEVGKFYGISIKEIKGSRRVQNIVQARQIAMYLSREMTDNSLPKIGREFGGKDHTTVMHAHEKIKKRLETDDGLRLELESIKSKLN